jgi:hypothetical protein
MSVSSIPDSILPLRNAIKKNKMETQYIKFTEFVGFLMYIYSMDFFCWCSDLGLDFQNFRLDTDTLRSIKLETILSWSILVYKI